LVNKIFDLFARRKKMKKLLLLGLAVLLFYATSTSAVLLQPGSAIPRGEMVISGLGYIETNDDIDINSNVFSVPLISYGLTDRLSGTVGYIFGNLAGDGLDVTIPGLSISGTIDGKLSGYTLGLNYCILNELADPTPVSLKVAGYYTGIRSELNSPAEIELFVPDSSTDTSMWDARIMVSKLIVPFVPYAGFKYASANADSSTSSITEIVVGTGLFFSPEFGLFAEYVAKNTSPESGDSTSFSQIGLEAVYIL
jgi:hypothetical protein